MEPQKSFVYILHKADPADPTHFPHVLRLLGEMQRRGWRVRVISEVPPSTIGESDLDVRYLARSKFARAWRIAQETRRARKDGFAIFFVRICRFSACYLSIIRRFSKIRNMYWQSATTPDLDRELPRRTQAIKALINRFMLSGIDAFVTGPESMIQYYLRTLPLHPSKVRLLYNDVHDVDVAAPTLKSDGPLRLLFVHRLSPAKRAKFYLPEILLGLPRDNSWLLDLVGDGPEMAEIVSQVENAGLNGNVIFHGAKPNPVVGDFYRRADIFLMPSYTEGFPRVIIEAMAAGLPIVTTDAGGTLDLLGPLQAEFVAPRSDVKSFAERLALLARRPDIRQKLSMENIERAPNYFTSRVADMFEGLLREQLAALRQ